MYPERNLIVPIKEQRRSEGRGPAFATLHKDYLLFGLVIFDGWPGKRGQRLDDIKLNLHALWCSPYTVRGQNKNNRAKQAANGPD